MERESMTDLRNRDARRSRWLAAAIAADLLLVVMQAVACAMYRAPHTGDAQSYWELALYCAQNHTFYPSPRDEFALYIFGNGYVNLLSLLLRLRETYVWVYAVNMAFTQLLVFSVYRIMRRLCEGREAACAAVTLLCLLPALWGEAASSRTELCFMGLAFASLACAMEDGTGWHALSGVLMALCNWVRPLMVILLPMTLLLLILRKKRLRCIAAYLLGAAAVIATIGQATKSLSGHFIYQAQTMGVNMLMGNNDDADGSYDNTVFGEGKIGYISEDERGVTYQVRDAFYKRQAVDWIVRHIPRFVQLIPRKLFYFLSTDTYGGTPYLGGGTETDNLPYLLSLRDVLLGRGERGFAFGDAVVIFSQLIYMAVLALFALDIVSAFRRGTWVRMLPFWGIFALACGIAVLTVGAPRYHMPYLPIFAMGAGDYLLAGRGVAGEPDETV